MPNLSADLAPYVADAAASMVVVKTLRRVPFAKPAPTLDQGDMTYEVLDVLASKVLKKGDTIEVPYERDANESARDKRGFNQWNNLSLEPGELLLLACKPLDKPKSWAALAAQPVRAVDSPEVKQVRRSYEIKAAPKLNDKEREKLLKALTEGEEVEQRVALQAVEGLPRDEAVVLLDAALATKSLKGEDKLELARNLTDSAYFKERRGQDPANQHIITTLARGLATENDPDLQREWLAVLAAPLLSDFSANEAKSLAVRTALIRGIDAETRQRVLTMLTRLAMQGKPGDLEIAADVLAAWKAAGTN